MAWHQSGRAGGRIRYGGRYPGRSAHSHRSAIRIGGLSAVSGGQDCLCRVKIAFIQRSKPPGIVGGLALQAINPKAYAVNTALFTGFAFMPDSTLTETLIKFAIMNAIWVPIHFLWLWAGVTLHRLDLSDRTQFIINVAMALSMLTVVGLAVYSQL